MIKNYFTIALRNILKHKVFSLINISGLSIGIAAFLLILQYVSFETSYDKHQEKGDRIFRLQQNRYNDGKLTTQWAAGAAGVGKTIKDVFPEIESMAKLTPEEAVISYEDKKFKEKKIFFATNSFLPMFSYKATKGNLADALNEPFTAVITESTAKKYFGNENPIGKVLSNNKQDGYKVTAVVPDMPENTHLKFDILFSFATYLKFAGPEAETTFDWDGFYTYILLMPGTKPVAMEKKIKTYIAKKIGEEYKKRNESVEYKLQPMRDIHLYSSYMMEMETNGNGQSVYFLLIIAVFIIIIAWINYINLSTARAIDRAKEVGVRKVLGSYRSQLIIQFMFEALLINMLAVFFAFILVLISLPLFNSLTGKHTSFLLIAEPRFWLAIIGLFIGGTLLAGIYPAFVMSSFKPITVLKGKFTRSKQGAFLRQSLVIIQFATSVILMVGTFGVYRQLNFMQDQDLGINIDKTLVLRGPSVIDTATYKERVKTFKTELKKIPGIHKVVVSTSVPGKKPGWNAGGIKLVEDGEGKSNQYRVIGIDYDFLEAYGIKVLKGRNFSTEFPTDKKSVLFNEAAVKLIGFNKPEDALNRRIDFWGEQYTIVGIVSNHHQEGLREPYDAHIFRLIPNNSSFISLKIEGNTDPQEIIKTAEKKWTEFFPGNPYEYFFLDDHYKEQYIADKQFGKTFTLFAVLAIVVACLGLLGLASFVTTQRTKEIGIRKISGATVPKLLLLLTKDFIKPVLVSFIIAVPITYYLLNKWLQNYAFKASITGWLFILPGLLILIIAIVTISTQTYKAANANPVKSLRTE
ncbi:MAG: ABC transporter permease [Bacteroidia bacterium]